MEQINVNVNNKIFYISGNDEFTLNVCDGFICYYEVSIKLCQKETESFYIYKLPLPRNIDSAFCTMCINDTSSCIPEALETTTPITSPEIYTISPTYGPVAGGTNITITGKYFPNPIFSCKLEDVNSGNKWDLTFLNR